MKNILVIGAGRSTSVLINYLLTHSKQFDWKITVADQNKEHAVNRIAGHPNGEAIAFDVADEIQRIHLINQADVVVSMLPAFMHLPVAKDCIALQKHMITASYVSPEMQELHEKAIEKGVMLLNEMGVDPGIDHMSAKKVLDEITEQGGEMTIFESFTGGLLSPEAEKGNPWRYKFTWNPRNVVLAGSGGAVKFKQEGNYKYIPYHRVFRRTELINIDEYGRFEGYANRDSLKYREVYGLKDIPTIYRGTLRRPGFCRAWNVFVQIGATDDSYYIEKTNEMTYRDFINLFLAYNPNDSVELKLMHYCKIDQDSDIMDKLTWLGIFDKTLIPFERATPAQILQHILEQKWKLEEGERDMIAMYHKFGYRLNNELKMIESTMVLEGEDDEKTAMAKTVGLPVAIGCKLLCTGQLKVPGVHIPIQKEIYEPMLKELEEAGIRFTEKEVPYQGY